MRAPSEEIEFDGVRALYAPHEKAALRGLIAARDLGTCSPESALEQVRLLHGLKVTLGATIVDEAEEALIRAFWAEGVNA